MREEFDVKTANLSYYCRECKQTVRGIPLTTPQFHINSYSDEPWLIVRCPTKLCELSFIIFDPLNDRVRRVYPLADFEAKNYHKAIPEKVREDIAEAEICLYADAYKGAVVMFRRAVQNIILNKIKDLEIKKKKLWEQIDRLFTEGLITKDLKESAHEIRHFGNVGAHPTDDELDQTTKEDAEAIEQLTFSLIGAIYITPFKTKQMQDKRLKAQQESKG